MLLLVRLLQLSRLETLLSVQLSVQLLEPEKKLKERIIPLLLELLPQQVITLKWILMHL